MIREMSGVSPAVREPGPQLVTYTDATTGFFTSNLYDVDEEVVQLTQFGDLIWSADGTRFPGFIGGDGTAIIHAPAFGSEVRFANNGRERRVYLIWLDDTLAADENLVDIDVVGGQLVLSDSNVALLLEHNQPARGTGR